MQTRIVVGTTLAVALLLAWAGMVPAQGQGGDAAGTLYAQKAAAPPQVDGLVDAQWNGAPPLVLPLTWGMDGPDSPLQVELRSLFTEDKVFFLAQWRGQGPWCDLETTFNKFTLHWRIAPLEQAGGPLACTVACHTAHVNGAGQFVYANSETIPQGPYGGLEVAGGWRSGTWTLEWARPLVSGNPYDLQFTDLTRGYLFFVKLFEGVAGWPDPVSPLHELRFRP